MSLSLAFFNRAPQPSPVSEGVPVPAAAAASATPAAAAAFAGAMEQLRVAASLAPVPGSDLASPPPTAQGVLPASSGAASAEPEATHRLGTPDVRVFITPYLPEPLANRAVPLPPATGPAAGALRPVGVLSEAHPVAPLQAPPAARVVPVAGMILPAMGERAAASEPIEAGPLAAAPSALAFAPGATAFAPGPIVLPAPAETHPEGAPALSADAPVSQVQVQWSKARQPLPAPGEAAVSIALRPPFAGPAPNQDGDARSSDFAVSAGAPAPDVLWDKAGRIVAAAQAIHASADIPQEPSVRLHPSTPGQWQRPLLHALGERVHVSSAAGLDQAVIRLDPPNLGRVEILIRQEAGALHVQLTASNTEVARQLQHLGDSLKQDLANRLGASEVSVHVADQSRQGDGRNGHRHVVFQESDPGKGLAEASGHLAQLFGLATETNQT